MAPAHPGDQGALIITRVLSASQQAVFDAWTTVESVRQWMCPEAMSVALAELDLRVGGAFRVDMLINGKRSVHTGIYREISPPEKLVFTWRSRSTHDRDTLVTVDLRALGEKTELTITQTLLPDEEAAQNHTQGWTQVLGHLAAHLSPR